jgi:EAL domain-containing protein (putative c-di-GMP-specific phosphodiesterase class I)
VEAILGVAGALPAQSGLGINVHASTLAMDAGFVDFFAAQLKRRGICPSRTVVEVVEQAPPWDLSGLRAAVASLRALGAKVALDDVGQGYSNYMMILECLPDYLKVDRHFVDGCHADFHRRAVLASMAQLARAFGARVVAEGVEEAADLTAVRRLGIALVQGFLMAEPAPVEGIAPPDVLERATRDGRPRQGCASR